MKIQILIDIKKVSQLNENKNKLYSKKINNNDAFNNYSSKFNKNHFINTIFNNSETSFLKANEDLKLKDPILTLNKSEYSEILILKKRI